MEYIDPDSGDIVDLDSVLGIQKALTLLGYAPGTADGVDGPHTREAVRKFQKEKGLAADGIAGPNTKMALAEAVGQKLMG